MEATTNGVAMQDQMDDLDHQHRLAGYAARDEAAREESAERAARLTDTITTLQGAAFDAVADTRSLTAIVSMTPDGSVPPRDDRIALAANTPVGIEHFAINRGAHEQFAERLGIPRAYYDRMLEHAPGLLAENVTHWLRFEPARRLLRLMKPITDDDKARMARVSHAATLQPARATVRAVLSDRYRPLDHAALLNTLLPAAQEAGAWVKEYHLDEKRFTVRFVTAARDVSQFLRPGQHHAIREVVRMGATISNSETGHASLSVRPFVDILICDNGLIVNEATRVRHVGGRAEGDEDWMSVEARRLDDAATFLKVRDRLYEVLGEQTARKAAEAIAEAAGTPITLPADVPLFAFVDGVAAKFDLSARELDILREEVVAEMALRRPDPSNALTRWTLSQAMTATARRVGSGEREAPGGFDRREELESAGWTVLTDATSALVREARASTRNRRN
jgi:hypothetical protein